MSAATRPGSHPLANCSTLLEVQDFAVVGPNATGTDTELVWVAYDNSASRFQPRSSLAYSPSAPPQKARGVAVPGSDAVGHGLVVLHSNGIDYVRANGARLEKLTFEVVTEDVKAVVGVDPLTGTILVGCQSGQKSYLLLLDPDGGETQTRALPPLAGTMIGGEVTGANLETYLILLLEHDGSLTATAIDLESHQALKSSVKLGPIGDEPEVSSTVAQLTSAPYRHLVCTYADSAGNGHVAALHVSSKRTLKVTRTKLNTAFAKPTRHRYRVAAGPLWNSGSSVVPVVVGYSGSYGSVDGCACLLLLEYEAATETLVHKSEYALDCEKDGPIASNDIHIAAGLYSVSGTAVWGVLVAGAGASLLDLMNGTSSVKIAVVGLDQNRRVFPPLTPPHPNAPDEPAKVATDTVLTMKGEQPILGFPCDLDGQSVRLGLPTFEQRSGRSQILAILQAPPFEQQVQGTNLPTLTFTSHTERTSNYSINSNKMWTQSKDLGANLSIGPFQIGTNITTMYGHGFDKLADSSTSNSVTVSKTFDELDQIIVFSTDYDVWVYPTFQNGHLAGTILVVFPQSVAPVQSILTSDDPDYGYVQRHEAGSLYSYLDSAPGTTISPGKSTRLGDLGFSDATLLFEQIGQEIGPSSTNSNWNFNQTKTTSVANTKIWNVHQSTNDTAGFSFSMLLFDFLPVSFGLNVGENDTYTDNDMKTTTLSNTRMIDIQIQYPTVDAQNMEFEITPLIFQHKTMGCLMVSYRVELIGTGWSRYTATKPLKLMAANPFGDAYTAAFSRSISFRPSAHGVSIDVEVFNNSLESAQNVAVDLFFGPQAPVPPVGEAKGFYQGWQFPFLGPKMPMKNGRQKPADQQVIPAINPVDRATVTFEHAIASGTFVCVFVYSTDWPSFEMGSASAYWRQYGESRTAPIQ